MKRIKRILELGNHHKSVLLLGPRQTGKSTLIREAFPKACHYNLMETDTFFRFQQDPSRLRQEIRALKNHDEPVLIDGIQKLPILLDEVQVLIDSLGIRFILTGSSARKLKAGGANLLGRRARPKQLFPFVWKELPDFSLERAIKGSLIPPMWFSDDCEADLHAYCGLYLKEEIQAESLVRGLDAFSRFLAIAALSNGQELNYENIGRDSAVPARTVREYVSVLTDTLIATSLPPWKQGRKRKATSRSKLYFFDGGVARVLAGKKPPPEGSAEWGQALEQLVFQELRAYLSYMSDYRPLSYWRTHDNREVDFILGDELAIEVKASRMVPERELKGLRDLAEEHPWKARILVCREPRARMSDDGILILPVEEFFERLWQGEWT